MIGEQASTPPSYKEDRVDWIKLLNWLIFLLFLLFVWCLIQVMIKTGREEAIFVFKKIRNQAYLILVFFATGLGSWIIIQRMKGRREKSTGDKTLEKLTSTLAVALMYTTFAYVVAQMAFNIGKLGGLF